MKRSELEAMGLSPENIDAIMAQNGKDIQAEKQKLEAYKTRAESADELQKRLDEIESEKLTEVEKQTKKLEEAQNRIAELERAQMLAQTRQTIATKFRVTPEQASQIIKDDGSMDYDILATIISDKETSASEATKKQIALGSSSASATPGVGAINTETEAEKLAISFGKSSASASTKAQSVVDSYL